MTGSLVLLLWAVAALPQVPEAPTVEPTANAAFQDLAEGFLAFHLYFNPVRASLAGDRNYDARLPDLGRSAIQSRAEAYQSWLDRLDQIDADALIEDAIQDRTLMEYTIRTELLSLVEVKDWQRDPSFYLDIIAHGVSVLVEDTGVPERDRMDALTSRLRQVSTLLAEARTNLNNPPASFTDHSRRGATRVAAFLRGDVLTVFSAVAPGPGKEEFEHAVGQAAQELDAFNEFLSGELAARSLGSAQLGQNRLAWTLQFREHVEVEPRQVLVVVEREMAKLQVVVRDSDTPSSEDTGANSSTDQGLRTLAGETMSDARSHIFRSLFVTIPSDTQPRVTSRPAVRTWDQSGIWGPGPLQPFDGPATFYVLSDDPPGQLVSAVQTTTLRAAFPGRFLATLYARRAPSRLRKVLRPTTLDGGWAHYAVQAMIGQFDPELRDQQARARLFELAQVRATLLFHLGDIDLQGASSMISDDAGVPASVAVTAAAYLAQRPLSSGVLGALQLDALRGDFLGDDKDREAGRTERRFHDAFLASGLPPSLARAVLLPTIDGAALR